MKQKHKIEIVRSLKVIDWFDFACVCGFYGSAYSEDEAKLERNRHLKEATR